MNAINAASVVAVVTVLPPNLDGNDAPPFKNKVTSFQVLVGGAAELNVHLLNEIKKKQAVSLLALFLSHITPCLSVTHYLSLPFHCSPWQMQCGPCHRAGRNVASYVPPRLPQPSQSGSLQPRATGWLTQSNTDINTHIGSHTFFPPTRICMLLPLEGSFR